MLFLGNIDTERYKITINSTGFFYDDLKINLGYTINYKNNTNGRAERQKKTLRFEDEESYKSCIYEIFNAVSNGYVRVSKSQSLSRRLAYLDSTGLIVGVEGEFSGQFQKGHLKKCRLTDEIVLGIKKFDFVFYRLYTPEGQSIKVNNLNKPVLAKKEKAGLIFTERFMMYIINKMRSQGDVFTVKKIKNKRYTERVIAEYIIK